MNPYNYFTSTEADWRLRVFDSLSFPTLVLKPDRTIIAANLKFHERNETTPGQVLGKRCKDIFASDSHMNHLVCHGRSCPLTRVLHFKKSQSVIQQSRDKEGNELWEERFFSPIFDENMEVKYIMESLRDITAVKKLEKQYSDMRELIDKVVQSSVSGIMAADRKGEIILMNEAAEKLFGYSVIDANQINIADFYPPGVAKKIMKKLRDEKIGERGKLPITQVNIVTKDSVEVPVEMTAAIIYEGEREAATAAIFNDLREKQAVQKKLEEAESQLYQSEKLASLGRLSAGVAHEINNPAAFVSMNLEEMQGEVDKIERVFESLRRHLTREDDQERRRLLSEQISGHESSLRGLRAMLNDNRDGIDRIRSVTRDLRMFSRVEQGEVVDIDLNAVVRSAVNLLSNELRHRARIKIELGELPSLAAERGKLGQVVTNLLLNAAQAIVEGAADSNLISVRTRQDGDHVILAVEDTGEGMDEEVSSRIFDPFFTTKPREQGTGLGLSLCAEIVSKHRGQLSVESTPGKGSIFEIRLPLDTGLVAKTPSPPPPVSIRPRSRMLIIDDDAGMVRAYRRMLAKYDAVVVSSGEDALDLIRAGEIFHLILCDLMMPEMDGPQVYEAIAELEPRLVKRIVFCTGGAFTTRAREFIATIDNPVLDKPITLDILERLLDPSRT